MVLAYGTMDMPDWGDPDSPASRHVSPDYISDAVEKTATPNIVTAVLADYRGYDTLGETAVIFSAGMACILLLRRKRKK
jgi:multicomponent Na+:H+ antiporter subunit B